MPVTHHAVLRLRNCAAIDRIIQKILSRFQVSDLKIQRDGPNMPSTLHVQVAAYLIIHSTCFFKGACSPGAPLCETAPPEPCNAPLGDSASPCACMPPMCSVAASNRRSRAPSLPLTSPSTGDAAPGGSWAWVPPSYTPSWAMCFAAGRFTLCDTPCCVLCTASLLCIVASGLLAASSGCELWCELGCELPSSGSVSKRSAGEVLRNGDEAISGTESLVPLAPFPRGTGRVKNEKTTNGSIMHASERNAKRHPKMVPTIAP